MWVFGICSRSPTWGVICFQNGFYCFGAYGLRGLWYDVFMSNRNDLYNKVLNKGEVITLPNEYEKVMLNANSLIINENASVSDWELHLKNPCFVIEKDSKEIEVINDNESKEFIVKVNIPVNDLISNLYCNKEIENKVLEKVKEKFPNKNVKINIQGIDQSISFTGVVDCEVTE